jgi:hypothetical protein
MKRLKSCSKKTLFLFFCIYFLSTCLSNVNANELSYSGQNKCDGMKVTVTFQFNNTQKIIKAFVAKHECLEGKGTAFWQPKADIEVKEDGSFYYKDKYGNFVKGRIDAGGKASGELNKGSFNFICKDDGVSYPQCTVWEAAIMN